MATVFRYKLDPRSKRITWMVIVLVALLAAWFTYLYIDHGGYLPAWFLTVALCIGALYAMSIPRSVRVTGEAIEIHCLVELTTVRLEDLRWVRPVDRSQTRLMLLLGSYGFFGYYGYYIDWRQWQTVKVYASAWKNLVEIEDIYDQRVIINCPDPEAFIARVEQASRMYEESHHPAQ